MMRRIWLISVALLLVLVLGTAILPAQKARADDTPHHYVSWSGNNTWPYNTWETATYDIGEAVKAAESGDTVYVAAGTYQGFGLSSGVAVISESGPDRTILDGEGQSTVVEAWDVRAATVLQGFTITNGGTGLQNIRSHMTVVNCTFTNNNNSGVLNSTEDEFPGGVNCFPTFINCTFVSNFASSDGGGMRNFYANPTLINCTFTGNSGYGIFQYGGTSYLFNCIVYGNEVDEIGGRGVEATYCDIQGWTSGGEGNINADPLFVNSAGGNVHLLPGSPCIDAGSNAAVPGWLTTDFDGEPRIDDGNYDGTARVDMGADEFLPSNVVGASGGTVTDAAGSGATFSVGAGVLTRDVYVDIEVFPVPDEVYETYPFFCTQFVNFRLIPNPSPLPAPGATITLPLRTPLDSGKPIMLLKFDPQQSEEGFIYTGITGAVDAGGNTATFHGVTDFAFTFHDVTDFSLFVGMFGASTTVTITSSALNVDAGSSVTLTVSETNDGIMPLTSPSVDLAVQGTPPWMTLNKDSDSFTGGDTDSNGELDVGETWTWSVTGVVVNATTTYEATGHGLNPLGEDITYPNCPTERATVTVNVVNRPPIADAQSVATNEDTAVTITLTGSDPDGDPLTFSVVTGPANGALSGTAPNLTYTPNANYNGADSFKFKANDGTFDSNEAIVTITATPVNDAPSFVKGADQTVMADAGAQTVTGWATAISAGPANESGQALNFIVSNDNNALFSVQPAVAPNGTLTYTPAASANGSATVTVQLHDNGGTANGGVDTSPPQTFTITVIPKPAVIASKVDIDPDTLNLKSQSDKNAITAYIELPSGYDVRQINVATVKLVVGGVTVAAQLTPTSIGDYDGDKVWDCMVKFDRQAVIAALVGKTGDISLTITGQLRDGRSFTGSDTIKVINPGK